MRFPKREVTTQKPVDSIVEVSKEGASEMIIAYLIAGLLGGTGASVYAHVFLEVSIWSALAIYIGAGNVSALTTAFGALWLRSRKESRLALETSATTTNEEGAASTVSWDHSAESWAPEEGLLRANSSRAA